MLDKGVIQPLKSPYSWPIVLQKKKEGSWQFCVDYRKLNAVTIKDKFPIPDTTDLRRFERKEILLVPRFGQWL